MTAIRFVIPGEPVAWKRPAKAKNGLSFDPNVDAKNHIIHHARKALGSTFFATGPVRLDVVAVHPRPKRRPEWCPEEAWERGGRIPAVTGADRSNILKLVEDALGTDRTQGWKVWRDDNQSAEGWCASVYATPDEEPHTQVIIKAIDLEEVPF